jgi:hypothetical protein
MAKKTISKEMRALLEVNRRGKIAPAQHRDIVIAPLMTLLVWAIPLSVVFLPMVLRMTVRLHVILPIVVVLYGGTMIYRAIHYSRAQVHVARLVSPSSVASFWTFVRAVKLHDESGEVLQFGLWLAPRIRIRRKQAYLVYYLRDGDSFILLSIAPADHPNAQEWQPTDAVKKRMERQTKNDK